MARPSMAASKVITGKLADWTKHPELKKYAAAFEYLQKTDFKQKEPGRVDIKPNNEMYATLSANKAKLCEDGKIEAHRLYTDIHYLVEGHETIGSHEAKGLEVVDPYKEANDVEFFKPGQYRKLELKPGEFAVFEPGQGHLPGCGKDTSAVIRKVVVKCRV